MVDEAPAKYYEEFLAKKEGKNKWTEYWVVIRGTWMLFYTDKNSRDRDKLQGSIELIPGTKCSAAKRRTYSFPFYISSKRGSHLFKCQSNLKRHQWIYVIGLAIKHCPPVPPPSFVPLASSVVIDSDGEYMTSWKTSEKKITSDEEGQKNTDNSDDDDDDNFSLPPGVIFVTTLPDELSQVEDEKSNNSEKDLLPLNAVLSTGITGTTSVLRDRSSTNNNVRHGLQPPKFIVSKPFSKSADSIDRAPPYHSYRGLTQASSSSSLLNCDEENRPSTSPLPASSNRVPLNSWHPRPTLGLDLKFSRHMTSSVPDVNALSVRDIL